MTFASAVRRAPPCLRLAVIVCPLALGSVSDKVLEGSRRFYGSIIAGSPTHAVLLDALPNETFVLCSGPQICHGETLAAGVPTCDGGLYCKEGAVLLRPSAGWTSAAESKEEQRAANEGHVAEAKADDEKEDDDSVEKAMGIFAIAQPTEFRVRYDQRLYACRGAHACSSWSYEGGRLVCKSGYGCVAAVKTAGVRYARLSTTLVRIANYARVDRATDAGSFGRGGLR